MGLHKNKTLIGFFILLMLSNSTLALEAIIHDNHVHGEVVSAQDLDFARNGPTETQVLHQTHQTESSMDQSQQVHAGEDCICDDICCASTVGFSISDAATALPGPNDNALVRTNLYQSVSLDLLLQPPSA
jgi:hypothetical protein